MHHFYEKLIVIITILNKIHKVAPFEYLKYAYALQSNAISMHKKFKSACILKKK